MMIFNDENLEFLAGTFVSVKRFNDDSQKKVFFLCWIFNELIMFIFIIPHFLNYVRIHSYV